MHIHYALLSAVCGLNLVLSMKCWLITRVQSYCSIMKNTKYSSKRPAECTHVSPNRIHEFRRSPDFVSNFATTLRSWRGFLRPRSISLIVYYDVKSDADWRCVWWSDRWVECKRDRIFTTLSAHRNAV